VSYAILPGLRLPFLTKRYDSTGFARTGIYSHTHIRRFTFPRIARRAVFMNMARMNIYRRLQKGWNESLKGRGFIARGDISISDRCRKIKHVLHGNSLAMLLPGEGDNLIFIYRISQEELLGCWFIDVAAHQQIRNNGKRGLLMCSLHFCISEKGLFCTHE